MSVSIDPSTPHYGHEDSYFVPNPSRWPLLTSLAATIVVAGLAMWFNAIAGGLIVTVLGLLWLFGCMYGWWRDVIGETASGSYKVWEDISFRWGMTLFIISEVMFLRRSSGRCFTPAAYPYPTWPPRLRA